MLFALLKGTYYVIRAVPLVGYQCAHMLCHKVPKGNVTIESLDEAEYPECQIRWWNCVLIRRASLLLAREGVSCTLPRSLGGSVARRHEVMRADRKNGHTRSLIYKDRRSTSRLATQKLTNEQEVTEISPHYVDKGETQTDGPVPKRLRGNFQPYPDGSEDIFVRCRCRWLASAGR